MFLENESWNFTDKKNDICFSDTNASRQLKHNACIYHVEIYWQMCTLIRLTHFSHWKEQGWVCAFISINQTFMPIHFWTSNTDVPVKSSLSILIFSDLNLHFTVYRSMSLMHVQLHFLNIDAGRPLKIHRDESHWILMTIFFLQLPLPALYTLLGIKSAMRHAFVKDCFSNLLLNCLKYVWCLGHSSSTWEICLIKHSDV